MSDTIDTNVMEPSQSDAVAELKERGEFKVLLNGQEDVQKRLQLFKNACIGYEKGRHRRHKRLYYNVGLMAKIAYNTTFVELVQLFKNGIQTFIIDTVRSKPHEIQEILEKIDLTLKHFRKLDPSIEIVTGLGLEINGDSCRLGRLHNGAPVLMRRGDMMTLTTNEAYKYSSFRQIAYAINLKHYLAGMKLNDKICIGNDVIAYIVKILKNCIAINIVECGIINSYDYIELPDKCYMIKQQNLSQLFLSDLELAIHSNANYIVITRVRCKPFLKAIMSTMKKYKIIASFDVDFILDKDINIRNIIHMVDYVWIPNMFTASPATQEFLNKWIIPISKRLKKPIIGTVPLQRCSDFKRFENHDFLWKIDTIFIQKSEWCDKYPLIVKKLLPVKNYHVGLVENELALKEILSSYQSIVNFIIRTISTIECHAIIIDSKCETAANALARTEIYCPVYVTLPLNEEDDMECKFNLARALNLRRNLHTVVYTPKKDQETVKPIDFCINYCRRQSLLDVDNFIITLEICKEDATENDPGYGDDVVILRAFYLSNTGRID